LAICALRFVITDNQAISMYWQYASNTSEIYGTALAPYFGWMILDMEMEKTLKKIRRQTVQKDKKQCGCSSL